ncbi:MAG TPA: IS200/IS605 family transposase [Terriglobales bacterium]|nr:IS200/IS605 family transposase [Terriglobales bacterium]
MSHTYASNRVHVIFSTKDREKRLGAELQVKLWPYMAGIAHHHGFDALKIGGFVDHVHALLLLPPIMPLAKAVQMLKGSSSHWLHQTDAAGRNFAWQEGYGAFSVSASQTEDVIQYIASQAQHHAKRSYEEEFLDFLKRYGISYDPQYVLG